MTAKTTTGSRLKLSGIMADRAKIKASPGIILPRVKEHMLSTFGWDAGRDPTVIHPSEMAKADWCLLATYLRIVAGQWPPDPGKFDFVRENIFATGNDIHAKWQERLIEAGFPVWGNWKCLNCRRVSRNTLRPTNEAFGDQCYETMSGDHRWVYDEVHMDVPELLMTGHADAGFDDTLVEIKSIGLGSVRMDAPDLLARHQDGKMTNLTGLWRDITRPLKSHLIQGDIYLHLARLLGLPFTQIVYLYEFKPNQLTKEFTIQYSADRVAPLVAKAEAVKYAVDHGIPPECIKKTGCPQCNAFPQKPRRTVARTRADIS